MPAGTYNRCSEPKCNRKAVARGMCRKHYMNWRRAYMENGVVVKSIPGSTVKEYALAPNALFCKLCAGNYATLRSPLPTFDDPEDMPLCVRHFREEVSHENYFIGKEAARQKALQSDLEQYTDREIRAMAKQQYEEMVEQARQERAELEASGAFDAE
jgi:hypothetical protein